MEFIPNSLWVDGSGRVTLRNRKFLGKFDKIVMDRLPGTARTVQPSPTTNRDENQFPADQRDRQGELEQQVPPVVQRQTPQPEVRCQVLPAPQSDPPSTQSTQRPPGTPVTIRTPLRCDSPPDTVMQSPPSGSGSLASPNLRPHSPDVGLFHGYESSSVPSRREILTDGDEFLLDRDAVPHTVSTGPPDQMAPPAQNSPPPPARRSQREKRPPARLGDYVRY